MSRRPRTDCTVLLALVLFSSTGVAEDWPGFLGPRRDGSSAEINIAERWQGEHPPVRWILEVGEGYSTPAITRGVVYDFDRESDRVRLSAYSSADGALLWRTEHPTRYTDYYGYSTGPRATPLVDGDRIYTYGVDGWLRSHDRADGSLLWEVDTVRRYGVVQNFFGVASSPWIEGDLLLVAIGGSPPGSPSIHSGEVVGYGSTLVAFDKHSGDERWRSGNQLASYSSPIVATVDGRRLGLYFARGGLMGFAPDNGRQEFFYPWRAPRLESVNGATPVVSGNQVLITESYGPGASLLEIDRSSYRVLWKDELESRPRLASHWSTPVLVDGHIYASSGEKSGSAELVCIEWKSGEVRWRERGLRRSTLVSAGNHLIVLTEYGELLLVRADPRRFDPIARSRPTDAEGRPLLPYPAWGPPSLSDGVLYLKADRRLVAMELAPGPNPSPL